jgi:thiamine biosynthesis lipoprotein ApbE
VTVVAPKGILSDSLTKVVSVLGPEKGFAILKAYDGVSARVVIATDQGLHTTAMREFPKLHANDAKGTPK